MLPRRGNTDLQQCGDFFTCRRGCGRAQNGSLTTAARRRAAGSCAEAAFVRQGMRRAHLDAHVVDVAELVDLRGRGTAHAGELGVRAEEVLVGDAGERDRLVVDVHALLRLDRLHPAPELTASAFTF